ncbi:hypothetical protein DPV78_007241 [Talaromyces pinophilus]|nr:hypothetical protein DPV78_007241 [Talaromyces pinophilus]
MDCLLELDFPMPKNLEYHGLQFLAIWGALDLGSTMYEFSLSIYIILSTILLSNADTTSSSVFTRLMGTSYLVEFSNALYL